MTCEILIEFYLETNELIYHRHALSLPFQYQKSSQVVSALWYMQRAFKVMLSQGTVLEYPKNLVNDTDKLVWYVPNVRTGDYRND